VQGLYIYMIYVCNIYVYTHIQVHTYIHMNEVQERRGRSLFVVVVCLFVSLRLVSLWILGGIES